jgi:phosphate uptake regulator
MTYARKLQKIGESLFVSLPKVWTKKTKLNRGDTVTIVENPDGSVTLYPEVKESILKRTTLVVESGESIRSLRRRVTGAYVDGFDLIRLEAKGKFPDDQQDAIREITVDLFGLEIVELTSNSVTVQCLLTKTLPIERMIQRIHSNARAMFGETIAALRERDPKVAKSVIKRMRDVKRLSLVVHRLLRSLILFPTEWTLDMKPIDSVDFLRVIDKITEISGGIRKIAESIVMWEYPHSDDVVEKLVEISDREMGLYDWSMQALMSKDIRLANRVLDENLQLGFDGLWNLLLKVEQESEVSAAAFSHMHRIMDNLKQIEVYSQEIAEIAIDRAEEVYEKERDVTS